MRDSQASLPPSEPRPSSRPDSVLDVDKPLRLQMTVALVLGLVLVMIPLYLWRRPRSAEGTPAVVASSPLTASSDTVAPGAAPGVTPAPPPTKPSAVTVSDIRVLACQDRGSKKTPPSECDHLEPVEKAFSKAIVDSGGCVGDKGGGLTFVADVSFARSHIGVVVAKDGRTIKGGRIAATCAREVQKKLEDVTLGQLTHAHARYKISASATYPAK